MRYSSAIVVVLGLVFATSCADAPDAPVESTTELALHPSASSPHDPAMGALTGGGHLRAGEWDISFAGHAEGLHGQAGAATVVVHFHNVSVPELSGGTFKAKRLDEIYFSWPGDPSNCLGRARLTMGGTFDQEAGWSLRLLVSDAGRLPDKHDTARLLLTDPAGVTVYDSSEGGPGGDFPRQSSCVGSARTNLHNGNVSLRMPTL